MVSRSVVCKIYLPFLSQNPASLSHLDFPPLCFIFLYANTHPTQHKNMALPLAEQRMKDCILEATFRIACFVSF